MPIKRIGVSFDIDIADFTNLLQKSSGVKIDFFGEDIPNISKPRARKTPAKTQARRKRGPVSSTKLVLDLIVKNQDKPTSTKELSAMLVSHKFSPNTHWNVLNRLITSKMVKRVAEGYIPTAKALDNG